MNSVPNKAGHTLKRPAFNSGIGMTPSVPAKDSRSGGAAVAVGEEHREQSNDGTINAGRFSGGREVHYNGGTKGIPKGSTAIPR
jgi:hypothetical protein